jgi:hypothetical protein
MECPHPFVLISFIFILIFIQTFVYII